MSDEVWFPVRSYNGQYAPTHDVSSAGRIRRGSRLLTIAIGARGYPQVNLGRRTVKVRKLVAEAFIGPRPTPKTQINHIDGDKQNNRVENLEFCSAQENILHYLNGSRRGPAHFSCLGAAARKYRLASKKTLRQAGVASGLSYSLISKIENGHRANVSVGLLVKLARAYGRSPAFLLLQAAKDYET